MPWNVKCQVYLVMEPPFGVRILCIYMAPMPLCPPLCVLFALVRFALHAPIRTEYMTRHNIGGIRMKFQVRLRSHLFFFFLGGSSS